MRGDKIIAKESGTDVERSGFSSQKPSRHGREIWKSGVNSNSPTEGRLTNLASISNEQLERCFLCGRKGREFLMRKSPIRLLIWERSADTRALKDHSQVGH